MKNRAMWLIAVVVMLFGLSPARAGITLSDNLSQPQGNYSPEPISDLNGGLFEWAAASFGTGTRSWLLQSVTLFMSAEQLGDTAQVDIYTDAPVPPATPPNTPPLSQPGSLLPNGILISPGIGTGALGQYTFTPSGSLSLAANSTYWVVVRALTGQVNWAYTPVGCTSCGSGIGFQNYWRVSYDGGTNWNDAYNTTGAFMMQVLAIPEPSTLTLFGTTALLLGLGYRRQAGNIA